MYKLDLVDFDTSIYGYSEENIPQIPRKRNNNQYEMINNNNNESYVYTTQGMNQNGYQPVPQNDVDIPVKININKKPKNKKNKNKKPPNDFLEMIISLFNKFNIKLSVLLFILYIIFNTDIFYIKLLSNISSNSYDTTKDQLTEKGLVVIGILLSISYLFLDLLDKHDYI